MRLKSRLPAVFLIALVAIVVTSCSNGPDADASEIRAVLHRMFDRPGTQLVIDPVVVGRTHAIADWTQSDMGGRALMRKTEGAWHVILCSGDGIRSASALEAAAVPPDEARELATNLLAAEQKLPPDRLSRLSRFEGTVRMDGTEHHAH